MNLYIISAGAFILLLIGGATGWHFGSSHYRGQYEALDKANWQGKALAEQIARKTLETQLATSQATLQRNAGELDALHQNLDDIGSDYLKLRAQFLHAQQASTRPHCPQVPKADSGRGAAPAPQDGGATELAELSTKAIRECQGNNATHTTLISEIEPQLR